jgi:hypothetical protein
MRNENIYRIFILKNAMKYVKLKEYVAEMECILTEQGIVSSKMAKTD